MSKVLSSEHGQCCRAGCGMSSELSVYLVQECIQRSEACIPDPNECWFSISFVADVAGYSSVENFRKMLNKARVPRHPFNRNCIRFSDLEAINGESSTNNSGV